MSEFLGKLRNSAEKIAKEADKAAQIKRIEWQISSIKTQIEDQYQKLGQMTYDSVVKKEPENSGAAGIITKVTELKQQIDAKEEEIKSIKEDELVPQASIPEKKFCTNCGKENDANSKFCFDCGTKMG